MQTVVERAAGTFIRWMRARGEAEQLAEADAAALLMNQGKRAYAEARRRERISLVSARDANDQRNRTHWRRVAHIIATQGGALRI
jgi:hypothetical protein